MRGRSRGTSKNLKPEPDPNQRKITNFFAKKVPAQNTAATGDVSRGLSSTPNSHQSASTTTTTTAVPLKSSNLNIVIAKPSVPYYEEANSCDEDDLAILTPPPKPPVELITILSSESEEEDDFKRRNKPQNNGLDKNPPSVCHDGVSPQLPEQPSASTSNLHTEVQKEGAGNNSPFNGSNSSGDEILSQIDIEEIINSSQEKSKEDEIASDSGDEVLSQIDIDEVIRSSQSSVNSDCLNPLIDRLGDCDSCTENASGKANPSRKPSIKNSASFISPPPKKPSPPSGSSLALTSPVKTSSKSPKSQLNYFSPIRHLRKRTSSAASLDSPTAKSRQSFSPTTVHLSPKKSQIQSERSPATKRLIFGGEEEHRHDNNQSSSSQGIGSRFRYYLRNFMDILTEVITDSFHSHLINSEDHKVAQTFISLSLDAQCLYVRLFQRKSGWKPLNKLNNNYKELPADLTPLVCELTSKGFFEQISASNSTLEEVLNVLDLFKMQSLGKKLNVSSAKKTKEACKEALLAQVKNQKTLTGCGSTAIFKAALGELGPAYRVCPKSKSLFSRLFILYSPPQYWEVETDQASNQLLVILLNNMGQMEYASYKTHKATNIYGTRDDLIRFHDAWSLHTNLAAFSESKDWKSVVELTNQASLFFKDLLRDSEIVCYDSSLPRFLRIYTAGSVLCHTIWTGVEGFQKLKQFSAANQLIQLLLSQEVYLTNYRGRMFERLAINFTTHLKSSKDEVRRLLEDSLRDKHLQENHKLILSGRLEKLRASMEAASKKVKRGVGKKTRKGRRTTREEQEEDEEDDVDYDADTQIIGIDEQEGSPVELLSLKNVVPTRTITGEKMDRGPGNMGKAFFIGRQNALGSNRISSVEQHAIDYYLENGYTAGLHAEGSTVVTMYGLLFWDIIFHDDLPDAFHTRYQAFPLDFHFDDFYHRRKDLIEEKLELIRHSLDMDDLCGLVSEVWGSNEKRLSIVNWSLFEDLEILKSLMKAMGKDIIVKLCERFARNYRYYHSGFPDLVVWNEKEVLFVEVKGPGDSLSPKQQLWLDFMLSNNIPAEVCYVKAVSNKRIRLD